MKAWPARRADLKAREAGRQHGEEFSALSSALFRSAVCTVAGLLSLGWLRGQGSSRSVSVRRASTEGSALATADTEQENVFQGFVINPNDEEVTSDDPLVIALEERLRKMYGDQELTLEMVLNPATIINAEREVIMMKAKLQLLDEGDVQERKKLEDKIEEKQMKIVNEMRSVMTDGLKLEFLVQGWSTMLLWLAMALDKLSFNGFAWLGIGPTLTMYSYHLLSIWGFWLLSIPCLRARKPGGPYGITNEEKRALDLCFLLLPVLALLITSGPKVDFVVPWLLQAAFVVGTYVWSYNTPLDANDPTSRRGAASILAGLNLPEPVLWAIRALDVGTGSELGAENPDPVWQGMMSTYDVKADELAAELRKELPRTEKTTVSAEDRAPDHA